MLPDFRAEVWVFLVTLLSAFTFAALRLWHAALLVRAEHRALDEVETRGLNLPPPLAEHDEVRRDLEAATRTASLKGTATAARVHALARLAEQGLPLDRSALSSDTEGTLLQPLRWPRAISNLLILVGLVGTLWGLTRTVMELDNSVQSPIGASEGTVGERLQQQGAVIDQLQSSITRTLGGMETAFVPALAAVALTILLLVGLQWLQAKTDDLGARLERVTDDVLLPQFRLSGHDHLQEAQTLAFRASRALVEATASTAKRLATSVDLTDKRLASSVEAADKRLAASVEHAENRMADAATQTRDTLSASSETAVGMLRAHLEASREATESVRERLVAGAAEAAVRFGKAASRTAYTLEVVHERMGESAARLDETANKLGAAVAAVSTVAAEIGEALAVGGQVAERLAEAESRHQELMRIIDTRTEAAHQDTVRGMEMMDRLAGALENLEMTRVAMLDLVATQQQWNRQTLDQVSEGAAQTEAAVSEVRDAALRIEAAAAQPGTLVQSVPAAEGYQRDLRLAEHIAQLLESQNRRYDERWESLLARMEQRLAAQAVAPPPRQEPPRLEPAPPTQTAASRTIRDRPSNGARAVASDQHPSSASNPSPPTREPEPEAADDDTAWTTGIIPSLVIALFKKFRK